MAKKYEHTLHNKYTKRYLLVLIGEMQVKSGEKNREKDPIESLG